jgi:DNA-binding FadR family transcriptional regulator
VRGNLEAAMAATVAANRTPEELTRVENALQVMRQMQHESDSFNEADVVFHLTVMELSRNRLAENITKRLYRRALESTRYHGMQYEGAFSSTLDQHAMVVDAIARQDAAAAEQAMRDHIIGSWQRRRFDPAHGGKEA